MQKPKTMPHPRPSIKVMRQPLPPTMELAPFTSTGFGSLDRAMVSVKAIPRFAAIDGLRGNVGTKQIEKYIFEAAGHMEKLIQEVEYYRDLFDNVPFVHPTTLPMHSHGPKMVWEKYVEPHEGTDTSIEFSFLKSILQWTFALTKQAEDAREGSPSSAASWKEHLVEYRDQ